MSRERCSQTEALHILMNGGLLAHPAAARLDQAVKTNDCELWHDGELMAPDYFARLLVIVARLEADGSWQADIRGNPLRPMVPGKRWIFEFDADQVRALLLRANDRPSEPPAHDRAQLPQRYRPGTRYTDDWPLEMVPELIRIAHHPVDREMLGNLEGQLVPHMKKYLEEEIGWAPKDPKAIREKLVVFLRLVRGSPGPG